MSDFSELLPQWRDESEPLRATAGEQLAEDLRHLMRAEPAAAEGAATLALTRKLTAALVERLAETIIPNCLQWLENRSLWQRPDLQRLAADDIRRALSVTLRLAFHLPPARIAPAAFGWFLMVALGAMAGGWVMDLTAWALALPPDAAGRRAMVAAALGAGLVAYLTARVLDRPAHRLALETAARSKGVLTRYRAIKAALARAGAGRGAVGLFVLYHLLRPGLVPPTAEDRLLSLQRQLKDQLNEACDLVLAFCLTHPDRTAAPEGSAAAAADAPPTSVYEAIGALGGALAKGPEGQDDLRDAAAELLQRFEEEGFEWREADKDAVYDSTMAETYRAYGLLEAGQPVLTRKPALFRHGKLLIRGILAARK